MNTILALYLESAPKDQFFEAEDEGVESNKLSKRNSNKVNSNSRLSQDNQTNIIAVKEPNKEIKKNSANQYYDEVYAKIEKRNRLPKERVPMNLNIWGILKDAVGKDLSKFCVPGK